MRTALLLAAAALAGCTLGPDFKSPDAPAAPSYTGAAQAETTVTADGVAQRLVAAPAPRNDWWTLFRSPELDALVAQALASNPSVDEARARLAQAREQMSAQDASLTWPQVDLDAGVKRQQIDPAALGFPQAATPPPFTVYNLGLDISYTLDLFGGTRRQMEAAGAHVDYAATELDVARRTLAANVVSAALRAATLRSRIATTEALLATQRAQLSIAEQRFALGAVAEVDVENQRALVAQTAALLPPLKGQLAATEHEIASYLGKAPADATIPPFTLAMFTLPAEIPVTLPAELVRQRPDVRASEALMHEASANVGVATANLYPKFTISGNGGTTRTSFADIANGINVWSIGLSLLQPVFHGGELQAQKRASEAAFDAARAAYRGTTVRAIVEVANAMAALEADSQALAARDTELAATRRVAVITRQRYDLGGVSQLVLLDAERQWRSAALDHDVAVGQRYSDTAALLAALGGTWRS